jgi:transcriptional regulator with XRE-family HTH domain
MKATKRAGRQLRELRTNAGLSPERLGNRVGVSGMTIRRLERGQCKPTVRTMFLLAEAFDMQPTDMWPIEDSVMV